MSEQENSSDKLKNFANNPYFIIVSNVATLLSTVITILLLAVTPDKVMVWLGIFVIIAILLCLILAMFVKVRQPFKIIIKFLIAYFILTYISWWFIHEKDWFFYKQLLDFQKMPEISRDVILIDIPYHDKITFRKKTGLFLQQLAQSTEIPSAVGLDIIFKKFDAENEQSREATAEVIKGIKLLTAKGVPVIGGYDPEKAAEDYDREIFDAVTDMGHNLIWMDNGKFYAEVYQKKRNSSETGIREVVKFFAVLMVKNGRRPGNDYIRNIEQKYQNLLPIQYQKNFEFTSCYTGDEKASDPICKGNRPLSKTIIF